MTQVARPMVSPRRQRAGDGLRWFGRQLRSLFDVHANPATFVYLFTLVVTSAVMGAAPPRLSNALLRTQSTNLTNLRHHPVHVLFTSAFWLDDGVRPGLLIVPFALVLVPAERWLGTRRWLAVFAFGHVGATIVTASVIQVELDHGLVTRSLTHTIDVGFSYGYVAIVGILTYLVPDRLRRFYVAAVGCALLAGVIGGATFTDIGHLFAWLLGLGCRALIPSPTMPAMPEAQHLSRAAYERLVAELEDLTTRGRIEIARKIESARELGDLSENGDYHAAKEEQGKMEGRIRHLEALTHNAKIVDSTTTDLVQAGSVVEIRYAGDDGTERYLIGSIEEKRPGLDVISPGSPLGDALLGAKPGDTVSFEAPSGATLEVDVVSIDA